jgi:hypothetical protein
MHTRLLRFVLSAALTALLAGCDDCDLEIITADLRDATVGVSYSALFQSFCGGDDWFLEEGVLPPGLGLIEDGVLRGTPTQAGTFTFTIGVFDFGDEEVAFKGFALTVRDPAPGSTRRATAPVIPSPTPTPEDTAAATITD